MALINLPDSSCYYRLEGADDKPVLMLSHALGQDHGMWDPQAAALSAHFRVLRYDVRGHGASSAPDGDYCVEQLGRDALALADTLGIERFAFCGLSLGGTIGLWIAANAPERLTHLVLANTSPRVDAAAMEVRRQAVAGGGIATVADLVMARFFSPRMLRSGSPAVAGARRTLLATSPHGYAGCCAALRDAEQNAGLRTIELPALVINGDRDVALPWDGHSEVLAREIPHARVVRLPAAHLSNLEAPSAFTSALFDFLLPREGDPLDSGMQARRAVLGDAHVDRALASAAGVTGDFQELITRYAWGTIWTRPGLDVRKRRLLVLAITASLGRWDEFRLHVRTGLPRDLEWCDLEEVLLQTAIYAGVPAANTGFRAAMEEKSRLE